MISISGDSAVWLLYVSHHGIHRAVQVHPTSGPYHAAPRRQVQMLKFAIEARVHRVMFEKQTAPNLDSVPLHG